MLSRVTSFGGGRRLRCVLILALKSFKPIKGGNMQKHTRLQKALVTRLARAEGENDHLTRLTPRDCGLERRTLAPSVVRL